MSSAIDDSSFTFIVSNGPKLQADAATRQTIRKQAMKDVGIARRRKGNYGKQNTRQLVCTSNPKQLAVRPSSSPDSSETLTSDSSDASDRTYDEEVVERQLARPRRKANALVGIQSLQTMSLASAYEMARAEFNVDILDLAMLCHFNVGKATIPILSADPSRLAALLGQQQWSYLEYVPTRYGISPCLTAAANCVLAKVQAVLSPQARSLECVWNLYTKALQTLQNAIADETSCMKPDVLCATQLLSLHELLDPTRDSAWSHHVNGAARLVKHRSTNRFRTDFEKALFAAHVGPCVSEALVSNQHCYLEELKWTTLYLSLMEETPFLTDRSPLTMKVRVMMIKLPGESAQPPFEG